MTEYCVIYCTVSSKEEGKKVSDALVQKDLAACVNMVGPVRSLYKWEGKTCDDEEYLLIIKSRRSLFDTIRDEIRSVHSYDVPEIIGIPIITGDEQYVEWMNDVLVK
mgnify:FL=1